MSNCKNDYIKIIDAWDNNVSSTDIYHMLFYWLNNYIDSIYDHNATKDMNIILDRMKNDDNSFDIVDDFVGGKKYRDLHKTILEIE
jgi:hypothetical protein